MIAWITQNDYLYYDIFHFKLDLDCIIKNGSEEIKSRNYYLNRAYPFRSNYIQFSLLGNMGSLF